jgi:6-bladed beta-propeller
MKTTISIWTIILLVITICGGCTQTGTQDDDFITVDVTANYPHKELVLQDFMDVEYIPLETTEEFLWRGNIRAVSKDIIVATNFKNDGNIFIFDRSGKALKRINHKGGSGEEYNSISRIVLDEENSEIFVNNGYAKKILVYDLDGNFKRRLSVKDNFLFMDMCNFDRENLICNDISNDNSSLTSNTRQSFMLISKQDGSVTNGIQIPFKEKKSIEIRTPQDKTGAFMAYMPSTVNKIVPYFENYILTELSADTLYKYSLDHTIKPFIVRIPSVQSINPEIFLLPSLLTDRYLFMEAIEKTMDFSATNLVYDKQEKALFRYKVYNNDYTDQEEAFLKSRPLNSKIPSCQFLEAEELVNAYQRGKLKGKLKEIAAKLDPEDNPVIMLIKHKK